MKTLAEKWSLLIRGHRDEFTYWDLVNMLDEKFTCLRCGRSDLPLALFREHDDACSLARPTVMIVDFTEQARLLKQMIPPEEFTCLQCSGLFDGKHMGSCTGICKWCRR